MGTPMAQPPNSPKPLASTSTTNTISPLIPPGTCHLSPTTIHPLSQEASLGTPQCHKPLKKFPLYQLFTEDSLHLNCKNWKTTMQDHSKHFQVTLRKSTHLNEKPFGVVPESNSTIKTHGKTKLGQACTTKMTGWNRYEQLIMAKMGLSKKVWARQMWSNTDYEQDFVWVFKYNFKVLSAPGLPSWSSSTKQRQLWVSCETYRKEMPTGKLSDPLETYKEIVTSNIRTIL